MKKLNPALSPSQMSAVRMLGYTLKLGMGEDECRDLARLWQIRLTKCERMGLLCSAIAASDPDDAKAIMDAALADLGAGLPVPAFANVLHEAALWADTATPTEREAYCLAAFQKMSPTRRDEFLAFASQEVAA